MELIDKLRKRDAQGRPVAVGIVGCGQMGSGLAHTINNITGMRVRAIADIDTKRAVETFRSMGYDAAAVVATENEGAAGDALTAGKSVATADALLLTRLAAIEANVEATGSPDVGCRVAGRFELCENYREIAQAWQGGFAEYMAVPEEAVRLGTIRAVSAGMDPAFAAIAEPVSSVVHAQEKGRTGLGDTVVVLGTGPIGCTHIQVARARGARTVIVADVNDERLKLCEPFEPDHLINAATTDLVAEVRRLTGGRGAEVVVTANPSPQSQIDALQIARKSGRVLLFGGLPPEKACPGVNTNLIHYNALEVIGTTIFAPRHHLTAIQLLSSGRVDGNRLVSHRFPLSDFVKGATMALEGRVVKAVFLP